MLSVTLNNFNAHKDNDKLISSPYYPITKSVKVFPTSIFLDKEGKIFRKEVGGIVDSQQSDELEATFKAIIDGELANEGPK